MKNESNYETREMIKNGITNKSTHKNIKKCETPKFFYAWTFKVIFYYSLIVLYNCTPISSLFDS